MFLRRSRTLAVAADRGKDGASRASERVDRPAPPPWTVALARGPSARQWRSISSAGRGAEVEVRRLRRRTIRRPSPLPHLHLVASHTPPRYRTSRRCSERLLGLCISALRVETAAPPPCRRRRNVAVARHRRPTATSMSFHQHHYLLRSIVPPVCYCVQSSNVRLDLRASARKFSAWQSAIRVGRRKDSRGAQSPQIVQPRTGVVHAHRDFESLPPAGGSALDARCPRLASRGLAHTSHGRTAERVDV